MIAVGGPAARGHVYFYDPADPTPRGTDLPDTQDLGRSGSGASITDLGDLYGARRATVAYGAPAAGADGRGAARINLIGGHHGDLARVWGPAPGAALGTAVLGLDGDGDGLRELYVSAPHAGAGAVWRVPDALRGEPTVEDVADGALWGRQPGDALGAALVPAGDTDGDGLPELWVGAPGAAADPGDAGRVYLVSPRWGGAADVEQIAWATLDGEAAGGRFGAVLAGDAREVGAPVGVAVTAPDEADGVVRTYDAHLRGAVPPAAARSTWRGAAPGGRFGAALLLDADIDGDGIEDLVVGAPGDGNGRVWAMGGG
jgi:hypothetical protein